MGNSFWFETPKNLVNNTCVIPTKEMSTDEKLNSITRFSILVSIAIMFINIKLGIQFLIVSIVLILTIGMCNSKLSSNVDIGPRDPSNRASRETELLNSSGLTGAIGGGYGNTNSNSNTASYVGYQFNKDEPGSLRYSNSSDNIEYESEVSQAGSAVGGGWGHGWAPGNGLNFQPETGVFEDSIAWENDPDAGTGLIEQASQVDGRDSYAHLGNELIYSGYNTKYNSLPDSGYPTPPGVSGQIPNPYLNTVYISPNQKHHPDAGFVDRNNGAPGIAVDGTMHAHSKGADRLVNNSKKASNSNFFSSSVSSNPGVSIAGSSSDYSQNGYSNLYSGDSGNNDPEHYVTIDKRAPIHNNGFINQQNITSYQPVTFAEDIDRSERLDAKTYNLWKDLTVFNDDDESNEKLVEYAGTEKISDQSYDPTNYKSQRRKDQIQKNTFSSFINERTAQDHGVFDDVPNFRQQMMRDYTPMRSRPMSFRGGNNAPREYGGNVSLTPMRPPMTPSPATPGF